MKELPTYVLERTFDASRELVWKAWTDPELLTVWYGPNVETVIHELDLRPGGRWLVEMKWDGNSNFQRADYTEVVEPERLVWLQSVTDANWKVITPPMMENWPRVLRTTVTFEANGDKTELRLTWAPHEATEAEIEGFANAMENMGHGWNAGMEILEKMLAEMKG